ncbi:MAG: uridylate kinase [Methylotenera sp.]|nr:uridylate kinase [Methylotenera sp.]
MWVVKLGGSLLGSAELPQWLALLAKHSKGQVVIVPGGGVFADAVRMAQNLSQVNDTLAHQLALLAMDQYGLLLAGMQPGLVTAASELEIAERGWQHQTMVWLPSRMVMADATVEQSWQVSSDSLSAWLANKLAADHLLLIKSVDLSPYQQTHAGVAKRLISDGVLDERFLDGIAGQPYQTSVLNKADSAAFNLGLSAERLQAQALLI